ncbi:MAG TPA: helix-turn-helix domain-containing protein [Acidimicrobiales bacterium]|nr:helix-turn-helix domain-containing protein [Acidimicrobiales bacterium]
MSLTIEVPVDWRSRTTVDVSTAGVIAGGLCRNSAYAAVARGDLPSIKLGRRIVVPVAALRRLLGELPEAGDDK